MDKEEARLVRAEKLYDSLLVDDAWYQANVGKKIAIIGRTVIIRDNLEELLEEVESHYADRTVFVETITRDLPQPVYLRPRFRPPQ